MYMYIQKIKNNAYVNISAQAKFWRFMASVKYAGFK